MKFYGENEYYKIYTHGDYKIIFQEYDQFKRDFRRVQILLKPNGYKAGVIAHERADGFKPERYFFHLTYGDYIAPELSALIVETYLKISGIIL